jgi:transcriptional regulator with XRE-family HTH domain
MLIQDPNAEHDPRSEELREKLRDFGRRIRAQREKAGMKATELATRLGVKPAYIYLIETARRVPREDKARELARILNDDAVLYVEWARAHRQKPGTLPSDAQSGGADERRQGKAPDIGIVTGEEVRFLSGDEIARKETRDHGDADDSRTKDIYRIPIIPPSESAGTDFIELKKDICRAGEQLVSPFAYRVSESSIGRVRNVLKSGDTVVFTTDIGVPDPREIYLVLQGERAVISRIVDRPNVLVLLSDDGNDRIDVIPHSGPEDLQKIVVGRIAAIIRPYIVHPKTWRD